MTRYYRAPTSGRPCPLSRGRRLYMLATGQTCPVDIFDFFFPDISLPLSISAFSHGPRQVQLIVAATSTWLHNTYIIYIHIYYRLLRYTYYINEIWKNNKIQTSCTRLSYKRPLSRTVCVCRVARVKLIDTRVRGIPRPNISAAAARSARNKWVSTCTYLYLIIPVCLPAYIIQWKYKPTVPNLLHSLMYQS